jgi:hypothetical protein
MVLDKTDKEVFGIMVGLLVLLTGLCTMFWLGTRCFHPRDVKVTVPQSYKAMKVENQALVIPIPAHEETIQVCDDKVAP